MEVVKPDYNNCIVNLANSIMKHFNLNNYHPTLLNIDLILSRNYRNVVVILYDGMGDKIYKRALRNSFFNKHQLMTITSVCPSTTTASTTSMRTGLFPSEHNWLGWDVYIKPINQIVTLYTNKIKDTNIDAANYHVGYNFMPFKSIVDLINENGGYARELFPFGPSAYKDLDDLYHIILEETKKPLKKYIYAYYTEPDSIMHQFGSKSCFAYNCIRELNNKTKQLCQKLEDTVLIVVSDHGHLDCEEIVLSNYPDFLETLNNDISIEARFCSFSVKNHANFKKLFYKYFGDDFILKTKKEIIEEHWFGYGQHKLFLSSLGDYIAIAKGNKYFRYSNNSQSALSVHAGLTSDEMLIPLIVVEK